MRIQWGLTVALIFVTLFLGSKSSPHFLDARFLMESATLFAEVGIIAIAMNFVITAGHIDLSVGSMTVLAACISAKLVQGGMNPFLGLFTGVMIGCALGGLNALILSFLRTSSFLVTVATMALYRGLAYGIMGADSAKLNKSAVGIDTSTFAGLTVPLWMLLAVAGIGIFVMNRTVYGRRICLLGANASAARYAGLNVSRLNASVFLLSGLACGVAAVLMNSRFGLARADFAKGIELDAITMVVVGGTSIKGGSPNLLGTVLAFALIVLMRTVIGMANLPAEIQYLAIGCLLVVAVIVNNLSHKLALAQIKQTQTETT